MFQWCSRMVMPLFIGLVGAVNIAHSAQNSVNASGDQSSVKFAVSLDNSMPLAEFQDDQLTGGILKDLGDAIAAELQRKVIYVATPRKRLDRALTSGSVDGVCYYRPEWVTVPLNWSPDIIPNEILLVAGPGVARPDRLEDVAGKTIGLVLGYKYPELNILGDNYQRDDAHNMLSNFNKLVAGRVQYAVIDRLSLKYREKLNPTIAPLSYLSITRIKAACGFSLASKIPMDDINHAITKLVKNGVVEQILAQYRR